VIPAVGRPVGRGRALGAVNTVTIRQGRIVGHNTDGSGWSWAFRRALPAADVSRIVQLGAGGAGAAVSDAALRLGAQQLVIVDREADRAQALADRLNTYHAGDRASASTDIEAALHGATGIVHCTRPRAWTSCRPALPADLLRADLWVSEIVYFPLETALLKAARAKGCRTVDGGGMAVARRSAPSACSPGASPTRRAWSATSEA